MDGDAETGGFSFVFNMADYAGDNGLQQAGEYLAGMRKPKGIGDAEFRRCKRFAVKFPLREGVLYRRGKTGMPPSRVLVKGEEKEEVLGRLHDESSTGEEMELIKWQSYYTSGTGFTRTSTAMSARARNVRNAALTASTSRYTLHSRQPYSRRWDLTWFTCRWLRMGAATCWA